MQKIILWGAGTVFANSLDLFLNNYFKSNYDIQAIVSANRSEILTNRMTPISIMDKENIFALSYDKIVIVTAERNTEVIRREAAELGIPADKISSIEEFLQSDNNLKSNALKMRTEIQLSIIKDILEADDSTVNNYEWLYAKICKFGLYNWRSHWYEEDDAIDYTYYGILQAPREFASFCLMLNGFADIKTAIEVGVFHGKSSYFMTALLQRKNPGLVYKMVDVCDSLDNFEDFHELLPSLHKCIPSTSEDYKGQHYDFVFIDADHSYDGSMTDYRNVGQYANKLVAFHDIYAHQHDELNGGTVRTWNEVVSETSGKVRAIFSEHPNRWLGIGTVIMK